MNKSISFVLLGIALLIIGGIVSAQVIQWQVGDIEGNVNPIVGGDEFPSNNVYYAVRDVNIDSGGAEMVGYINDNKTVCQVSPRAICTDTAAVINLNFTLQCNVGNAVFRYGRYGSETDLVSLNGAVFDTFVGSGEGNFREETYNLGSLSAGSHTITIDYNGGGSGNGHYIDYVSLDTQYECLVDIDIKPGSYPSSVNLSGGGSVPIAIFGSATFDVNQINLQSLNFEGAGIRTRGNGDGQCGVEDINGDGANDLVCQFIRSEIQLTGTETEATVTGTLYDGTSFEGTGDINIVD